MKGIHHVTVTVRDLDRMGRFLVEGLGAREIYDSAGRNHSLAREKFFLLGDLWMVAMEGGPGGAQAYDHVALAVSPQELEACRKRLEALGAAFRPPRERIAGEGVSLYVSDFDGHLFELHAGTLEERLEAYGVPAPEALGHLGDGGGPPLTHLGRRKIQAPVAQALLGAFEGALGPREARRIAAEGVAADAFRAGRLWAGGGDRSLGALGRVVREEWAAGGALELRFLEETPERLRFDVLRCAYVGLYEGPEGRAQGFCLSCARDGAFVQGFNPRIRMERRGTLMEGAPRCDFLFVREPSPGGPS